MEIQLYTIVKDRNSTALPVGGAEILTGTLRAPTSVTAPVIEIERRGLPNYNYAYIPDFRRFYWIDSCTAVTDSLFALHMSVDVLATYKSYIGISSQYVLRSASQFDGNITDTMYPTANAWYESRTDEASIIDNDYSKMQWCVGIKGTGATKFYIFNHLGIASFFSYLLSPQSSGYTKQALTALGIGNNSEAAVVVDPLQYITSVVALPMEIYDVTDFDDVSIKIGNVTHTAEECVAVDYTTIHVGSWQWVPPAHPDAAERGAYLNNAPYAEYYLFIPGFGKIDIDPSYIAGRGCVDISFDVDPRSGDTQLLIEAGTAGIISRVTTTLGVPVELSQVIAKGTSALTQTANVAGLAGQLLSGNITGAIASGASAIQTALNNRIPSANSVGNNGSFAGVAGDEMQFIARFARPVDENYSHLGRPLCKTRYINQLSGYIMCSNAHFSAPNALADEVTQVEAYMNGGFFYE